MFRTIRFKSDYELMLLKLKHKTKNYCSSSVWFKHWSKDSVVIMHNYVLYVNSDSDLTENTQDSELSLSSRLAIIQNLIQIYVSS